MERVLCLTKVSEKVEITIPVTEEKEINNNKYADKEIIDAVAIFDEEVKKIKKLSKEIIEE